MAKKLNFMIVGTFDVDNYGDCIFPDVFHFNMKKRFPDFDINLDLFSPYANVANIGNYSSVKALPGTIEECKKLEDYDCQVLVGGEVLQSGHHPKSMYCNIPVNTMSAGMRLWMVPMLIKYFKGTPSIYNGLGIGRLENGSVAGLAKVLELADYASFRDQHSKDKLKSYGLNVDTKVVTDSVFTLKNMFSDEQWKQYANEVLPAGCSDYIVVQPRLKYLNFNHMDWFNSVEQICKKHNKNVLLLPICYHHSDHVAIPSIQKELETRGLKVHAIPDFIKTHQTAAVISQGHGYIGTSLHGTISSISFSKPTAVLAPKGGKYDGVLKEYGVHDAVTDTPASLVECFDYSYNLDREELSNRACNLADEQFDQIAATLTSDQPHNRISEEDFAVLNKSIEFDQKHYERNPKDKTLRSVFMVIRNNTALYNLYERFSAYKNRHKGL